jgi:hypothetical protein
VRWKPWRRKASFEESSRFLRLGKIGFVPLSIELAQCWRHVGPELCGIRALSCDDLAGISRLSVLLKLTEYTGEPLWLTGTVSKIC